MEVGSTSKRRRVAMVMQVPPAPAGAALGSDLVAAVQGRDAASVARLLRGGADPNTCHRATPAILLAVMTASPAEECGKDEDVHIDDSDGAAARAGTPTAGSAESLAIVRQLLAAGADPSASDPTGRAALLVSILAGNGAATAALLAHDPPPKLDARCSIAGIALTPIAAAFTYGGPGVKDAVAAAAAAAGPAELARQERLSAEMSEFLNTVCDDVDASMEGPDDDGYAPNCVRATLRQLGIDPDDFDVFLNGVFLFYISFDHVALSPQLYMQYPTLRVMRSIWGPCLSHPDPYNLMASPILILIFLF